MSGIDLRLKKLFKGKKHLVISALDHVMEYGDQPGIEDAARAIASCNGTDAGYFRHRSCDRNASSISRFCDSGAPMASPSP